MESPGKTMPLLRVGPLPLAHGSCIAGASGRRGTCARSAKVGTGFVSDRALTIKLAHDLIGEPVPTSPDQAQTPDFPTGPRGGVVTQRTAKPNSKLSVFVLDARYS